MAEDTPTDATILPFERVPKPETAKPEHFVIKVGDRFTLDIPDKSVFNRLMAWAFNRPIPNKKAEFIVTGNLNG
jgi:hypothetical protein